jgi:hypothetical protein
MLFGSDVRTDLRGSVHHMSPLGMYVGISSLGRRKPAVLKSGMLTAANVSVYVRTSQSRHS